MDTEGGALLSREHWNASRHSLCGGQVKNNYEEGSGVRKGGDWVGSKLRSRADDGVFYQDSR